MSERRVGLVVTGGTVKVVDAEIPDDADEPIVIVADDTWQLQKGPHPEAYSVIAKRCANYLKENNIARAVVKASELSGSTKLAHLESAELRGVIVAAAASVTEVTLIKKSVITKTYGARKFDEYLKDHAFWDEHTTGGDLRKTSREAAMVLIALRKSE